MKPACGPPSNLSPENVTRSAPSAIASATVGSCASPKRDKIDERPGAKIVDQRHTTLTGKCREVAWPHFGGKSLNAVIGRVNLENQSCSCVDRRGIILEMRPVRRTDLSKLGAGPTHDLGHAEGAADLDKFAARDDRGATLCHRIEHNQHRSSIVVDDGGVLGACQLAQQSSDDVVAIAAARRFPDRIPRPPHSASRQSAASIADRR